MRHSAHPIEQEEVMAYLDGELAPKRAASVAAHLEECGECRILAEELRGISRQMLAWEVEAAPEPLVEPEGAPSLLHALSRPKNPLVGKAETRTARWLTQPTIVIFTMGAALAAVIAFIVLNPGVFTAQKEVPTAARATIADSAAGTHQFMARLPELQTSQVGPDQVPNANQPLNGPMVVRTAELTLITKEIDSAREAIERIVTQNKGYVARLDAQGQTGAGRTLTATVRVPANQLDTVLAELKKLGQVSQETQKGEEVSFQYADLQARLTNARRTETSLIELLAQRTGKLSDVLEVERELDNVRGQIERMDAQRRTMENQVQFATVNLSVREEYNAKVNLAPYSTGTRLRNAVIEGWQTAAEVIVALAVFLLSYSPTLIFAALILFWPARWAWRRLRLSSAS
jgi:hypothetical protein